MSENTLNRALHRMGYRDQLTGHGIRATISTALHEIGYGTKWIDAQLSHTDPNQVRKAFNHAEYVEQRRRMMQDWADRLDQWEQCPRPNLFKSWGHSFPRRAAGALSIMKGQALAQEHRKLQTVQA